MEHIGDIENKNSKFKLFSNTKQTSDTSLLFVTGFKVKYDDTIGEEEDYFCEDLNVVHFIS